MVHNGYKFSCTEREVIDEHSNPLGIYLSGPKFITKFGMYCYCWVGCLTVMYEASEIGLIQIADIKKNNDYAIWLKVIRKANCYLLKENLAKYRKRSGSISNHSFYKLIKWHYKLFREAEGMSRLQSTFFTCLNMFFGIIKKCLYTKK